MIRQLAVSCCLLAACTSSRELRPDDVRVERILLASDFELARVAEGVWIHTTFKELPGVGPFSLLEESAVNHWGKLAFKWMYWNLLLRGKELPISHRMQTAGKRAPHVGA